MANRVGVAPSMIIYGPPGVGKTELARHIAAQIGLPLITSRSDALISSFLGSTAKNLRLLFEHAVSRPCVLFLDELDALAKLRDDQHEMGELKRVVVSLLQNIDALENEIVLIGATNHHHLLDPAIWRRFAYRLELPLPSATARRKLIELFLGEFRAEEDIETLVTVMEGLSGADIRLVCENAIRCAVLEGATRISATALLRGAIRARLGETFDFTSPTSVQVRAVHDLGKRVFTCKRLAAIFGTSGPTISRRLNVSGGSNGRERTQAADQSSHADRA
jgi:ATP-dependent 26S proteasome regulatory subunit